MITNARVRLINNLLHSNVYDGKGLNTDNIEKFSPYVSNFIGKFGLELPSVSYLGYPYYRFVLSWYIKKQFVFNISFGLKHDFLGMVAVVFDKKGEPILTSTINIEDGVVFDTNGYNLLLDAYLLAYKEYDFIYKRT